MEFLQLLDAEKIGSYIMSYVVNLRGQIEERYEVFLDELWDADPYTKACAALVALVWALKMVHETGLPGIPLGYIGPRQYQVEAKNKLYASAGLLYFKVLTTAVCLRVPEESDDFKLLVVLCAILSILYALIVLPPGTGRITRHLEPTTPSEEQKKKQ
jgi:hypothetical protein